MKTFGYAVLMCVFSLVLISGTSYAGTISGAFWEGGTLATPDLYPLVTKAANNPGFIGAADASSILGLPDATFSVDSINFITFETTQLPAGTLPTTTYGDFLGGPANANNLTGLSASDADKPLFTLNGSDANGYFGTFFQLTWTAYFAAGNYSITHDDGFWMQVGTWVFDLSTPVAVRTDTINIPTAGVYSVVLNYGAVNSTPEALQIPNIGVPVPEPSLVLLLGLGVGAACLVKLRLK